MAPRQDWLTTAEAAKALGTSRRIVQRLVKSGRLPAMPVGESGGKPALYLINPADLDLVRKRPPGRPPKRD